MRNKKKPIAKDYQISKILSDTQKITAVLQESIDEALLMHKKAGNPVCEWKNNKVVWIQPDKIPTKENKKTSRS